MASVDLKTNEIIGCKPNSFEYFHEVGHIEYNRRPNDAMRSIQGELAFKFCVMFVVVNMFFVNIMIQLVALTLIMYWAYTFLREEMFCNTYAKARLKLLSMDKIKEELKCMPEKKMQ